MTSGSFFGVFVMVAGGIWCVTVLPSLIGGVALLKRSRRPGLWSADIMRLVAVLMLKPVLTTAIFIMLLAQQRLVVLLVLGPAVTVGSLVYFRATLRQMPPLALAILLLFDAARWGSTMLTADQVESFVSPPMLIAISMPTLFMISGWLLISRGHSAADPARRLDRYHLLPALSVGLLAAVGLLTIFAIDRIAAAQRIQAIENQISSVALTSLRHKGFEQRTRLDWSPDGTQLAATDDLGALMVVDVARDKLRFTFDTPSARIDHVAWSPRGDVIAVQLPIAIQFIDARTGEEMRTAMLIADEAFIKDPHTTIPFHTYADAVWSPDGSRLAVDAGVWDSPRILDPYDPQADRILSDSAAPASFAWSPDSRYLAIGTDEAVGIWDVQAGTFYGELSGSMYRSRVNWSPDGRLIEVHGWMEGGVEIWDAATLEKLAQPMSAIARDVKYVAWHPSGTMLAAAADSGTQIWELNAEQPLVYLEQGGGELSWSADGRWLMSGAGWDNFWIWDRDTQILQPLENSLYSSNPVWHPQAAVLATPMRIDGRSIFGGNSWTEVRLLTMEP